MVMLYTARCCGSTRTLLTRVTLIPAAGAAETAPSIPCRLVLNATLLTFSGGLDRDSFVPARAFMFAVPVMVAAGRRTIPATVREEGLILLTAHTTHGFVRMAFSPRFYTMLAVPLPPLGGGVPRLGQRAYLLQVLQLRRGPVQMGTGLLVVRRVLRIRHHLQVTDVVVRRVVVPMVDAVPVRDRPVVGLPHYPVKNAPILRKISLTRPAIVAAPVINCDFHLFLHDSVLL